MFYICSPSGRKNKDELVYKNKLKSNLKNNKLVKFKSLNNSEIFEYYKASDTVLLPSLIEGISIAILEAMAFSKVVIATNVGGTPEIIKDKKNGFLVELKNSDDLLSKLSIVQSKDNSHIEKEARKTVQKKFSSELMFKKYYKVFKKIKYENK